MRASFDCARIFPLLMLALVMSLACWAYAPGVNGPALLDDHSSLNALSDLSDSPELAADYILGDRSGPLGRSVSMATFVLESLLGDGSTVTSKWVNIGLHLVLTALVGCLFMLLLSPLAVPRAASAAVVFAGFWCLAPLQVSTVLYAVQRMAMLSACFSLLSVIGYLLWRRTLSAGRPRHGWVLFSLAALVVGIFAKENALVTVPLLLLTEACWLQFRDDEGRLIPRLQRFTWIVIALGVAVTCVLLVFYWSALGDRYGIREFTLEQRLLTQPRILWDYVSQFYLPDMARLGIYHDDYELSTSIGAPVTTLPAILAWLVLLIVIAASWRWPSARRLSFGVLFFLAAHSLESTVWPLELYFEHRNYLPSVGLALLPLAFYAFIASRWQVLGSPMLAWSSLVLIIYLALTSSQVQIWSHAPLLAFQHINGHPGSARANREMATQLALVGARDQSLAYSKKAYEAALVHRAATDEHYGDYLMRDLALACIAQQPLTNMEYQLLGRKMPDRPLGEVSTMAVAIQLRQENHCPGFDWSGFQDHLAGLYLRDFDTSLASANMFTALAMLANASQRWREAYEYTARSLSLSPGRPRELLMQLHFSTLVDDQDAAQHLVDKLQAMSEEGKLNQGEQDTLALYTENQH